MTEDKKITESFKTKKYKVLIPYTESASPKKNFKIEYDIEAATNEQAKHNAENMFNLYNTSSSASWVRTMNKGGIRVWRILEGLPQTTNEIDNLSEQLINVTDKSHICDILEKLSLLEDAATTSYILFQTKNPDIDIVCKAIGALNSIGDPTSLLVLKNLYKNDTPAKIKVKIIGAISRIALPEDNIIDFMSNALKDNNEDVRNSAERAFDILESRALASGWVDWIKARQKRITANADN